MIDLHDFLTPNDREVALLLEETRHPDGIVPGSIGRGEPRGPELPRMGPRDRTTAIACRRALLGTGHAA